MTEDPKRNLRRALRLMLRPIVRILLRGGLTWKEAAESLKATFVEVATRDYGLHGRPTNASRVAILTGLSRREVGRLRKELADETEPQFGRMNSATRLLTGWHLDTEFLDASGQPVDLSLEGEPLSFKELARRYGGDIAPITLARELVRNGAVIELPDKRLRVVKRFFLPSPLDPVATLRAGSVIRDLGDNIAYNLGRGEQQPTRFEGRASNDRMLGADAPAFRAFLEREGQAFLERVDEWLAVHEATPAEEKKYRMHRFGIGIYQIQDDSGEGAGDES